MISNPRLSISSTHRLTINGTGGACGGRGSRATTVSSSAPNSAELRGGAGLLRKRSCGSVCLTRTYRVPRGSIWKYGM